MWNVTWDPVHLCMTDSSPPDLCRHQSELALPQNLKPWHTSTTITHTIHPTTYTHTHTARPHCTSTAIIHQIYLHWSRAKIKNRPPTPLLRPPTSPRQPWPNPITARYSPWLIGFQSNWISLRWRWEGGGGLPCSKPLGIGIGRKVRGWGGGGMKMGETEERKARWQEKRSNWERLRACEIEEDWRRKRERKRERGMSVCLPAPI